MTTIIKITKMWYNKQNLTEPFSFLLFVLEEQKSREWLFKWTVCLGIKESWLKFGEVLNGCLFHTDGHNCLQPLELLVFVVWGELFKDEVSVWGWRCHS